MDAAKKAAAEAERIRKHREATLLRMAQEEEMRKAAAELTDALAAIDASMRAFDIFGAPPPPLPPPKPGGGDLTGMI